MTVPGETSGHSQTGRIPTSRVEPVEELLEPLDRHLDVLDHLLALGPALPPVDAVDEAGAVVERDQLVEDVGAPVATRPEPADDRVLGTRMAFEHQNQSVSQRHR